MPHNFTWKKDFKAKTKKKITLPSWFLPEFKIWSLAVSGKKLLERKLHTCISLLNSICKYPRLWRRNLFFLIPFTFKEPLRFCPVSPAHLCKWEWRWRKWALRLFLPTNISLKAYLKLRVQVQKQRTTYATKAADSPTAQRTQTRSWLPTRPG